MRVIALLLILTVALAHGSRLSVNGTRLMFNGKSVFLSGVNYAWNSYGYDFGNGKYTSGSKTIFQTWLSDVNASGGNVVRVWVHVEGYNTPAFNSNGFITGPDVSKTLTSDLKAFLDAAKLKNVMVIFTLWNGAVQSNQNVNNLFWDKSKLTSYLTNALTPMVKAVAGHPALAAWDIINEPEALVYNNKADSNLCFDTRPLVNTGAGWVGKWIPMQQILLFINWHAAAIKAADPGVLVTVGSWSEHSITDAYSDARNYYKDSCLVAAGGNATGKIDFYHVHTYSPFGSYAPFKVSASAYKLTKPVVIGEFAAVCSGGMTSQQLFNYAYTKGYQGANSWQYNAGGSCSDTQATQKAGMLALKGLNGAGGLINFTVA